MKSLKNIFLTCTLIASVTTPTTSFAQGFEFNFGGGGIYLGQPQGIYVHPYVFNEEESPLYVDPNKEYYRTYFSHPHYRSYKPRAICYDNYGRPFGCGGEVDIFDYPPY